MNYGRGHIHNRNKKNTVISKLNGSKISAKRSKIRTYAQLWWRIDVCPEGRNTRNTAYENFEWISSWTRKTLTCSYIMFRSKLDRVIGNLLIDCKGCALEAELLVIKSETSSNGNELLLSQSTGVTGLWTIHGTRLFWIVSRSGQKTKRDGYKILPK